MIFLDVFTNENMDSKLVRESGFVIKIKSAIYTKDYNNLTRR